MISRLEISNFQSHRNTKLDLDRFTVIVGASSSGKSSVVRALRLVARNIRGTSYVRNGQGSSKIRVVSSSETDVSIERGSGKSIYELRLPGSADPQIFTKCGTSTPPEILTALEFGDDEMWVAGQFDRPFLLDETGSQVARVLGELTNVSMIFAAVRECNRRRDSARSQHSRKSIELDQVRSSLQHHMDLPQRLAACSSAEDAVSRAQEVSTRRVSLSGVVCAATDAQDRLRASQAVSAAVPHTDQLVSINSSRLHLHSLLSVASQAFNRSQSVVVPDIPSDESLQTLSRRHDLLLSRIREVELAGIRLLEAERSSENVSQQVMVSRERLGTLLNEGGACPVCGAAVEHARVDHILM